MISVYPLHSLVHFILARCEPVYRLPVTAWMVDGGCRSPPHSLLRLMGFPSQDQVIPPGTCSQKDPTKS